MRTIKFRVWDHDEERFIEWFNPDPMLSCKDGELWCYERRGKDENGNWIPGDDLIHTSISKRNLTLQQFTDLLDKNGKEIYEGDLLEFAYQDDGKRFVGEVQYFKEFGSFGVVIDKAFETFQDLIEYSQFFNVVGNILETKLDGP